LCVLAMGNVFA